MKLTYLTITTLAIALLVAGCKKDNTNNNNNNNTNPVDTPMLVFKIKFDTTQTRLNNVGDSTPMPAGHAGQNPQMHIMGVHYIEMAQTDWTQLGTGAVLYKTPVSYAGGDTAIDYTQEATGANGDVIFKMPLKNVAPGTYKHLRVSLAYQNYDVMLYLDTSYMGYTVQKEFPCTIASFVGSNTYLSTYKIKNATITVNASKKQGYWGFESNMDFSPYPYTYNEVLTGQAPSGATTVVNPLAASSPIPAGSCVVTAPFSGGPLTITGTETHDVVVVMSMSINKSFEWVDVKPDGKWEPAKGENIVDMGIRGMVPTVQ